MNTQRYVQEIDVLICSIEKDGDYKKHFEDFVNWHKKEIIHSELS